jgi:hypothetical protein
VLQGSALEKLAQREVELESTDSLLHELHTGQVRIQQLLVRSFQSHELRRVHTIREIKAYGTDWSAIADPEANRVNHIVEVFQVTLFEPER